MGEMSEKQLAWRKRQVTDAIMQRPHNYKNPEHLHRKSYEEGYMRCTHCKKWLHPDIPEEAKEMKLGKRGNRRHDKRYCPINSPYVASMVMYPKFRPTRSRRVKSVKRY